MRGSDERTGSLFSYVGVEARLRPDHPLRAIRALADETLGAMERELASLYSDADFSVFSAARSEGAMEWPNLHGNAIVLLFTNVEIPGQMDGFALARRVAEAWPSMAILVSSGRHTPRDQCQRLPPSSQNRSPVMTCSDPREPRSLSKTLSC